MTTTNQTPAATYKTKRELLAAKASWLESRPDMDLFAITAVFKAGHWSTNAEKYESLFRTRVLKKVQRQISRKEDCLFADYRYEFGESSRYKSMAEQRKPHHIHGVIAIPKASTGKIWNEETATLQPRISKDLRSIRETSSILLEPVRKGGMRDWLGYMAKGKSLDD